MRWCFTLWKFWARQMSFDAILFLSVPVNCVPVGLRHFALRSATFFSSSELWHPSQRLLKEGLFFSPQFWGLTHKPISSSFHSLLLSTSVTNSSHCKLSWSPQRLFPDLHKQLLPNKGRESLFFPKLSLSCNNLPPCFQSLIFIWATKCHSMLKTNKTKGSLLGTKTSSPQLGRSHFFLCESMWHSDTSQFWGFLLNAKLQTKENREALKG